MDSLGPMVLKDIALLASDSKVELLLEGCISASTAVTAVDGCCSSSWRITNSRLHLAWESTYLHGPLTLPLWLFLFVPQGLSPGYLEANS